MIKKDYMKPTMTVVQLQHSQLLASSYTNVRTENDDDDDNPVYDGSKKHYSIWDDAN